MAVFRVERTRDYTVMCNHHLKDSNLSLKAKGLLSMMLSLPDEWNYTTRGLAAICKEGVDAIGKTLKELELAGYIIRRQLRGKDGRISDTEYTIFEKPRKPSPPDTTLPDTENPYLDMIQGKGQLGQSRQRSIDRPLIPLLRQPRQRPGVVCVAVGQKDSPQFLNLLCIQPGQVVLCASQQTAIHQKSSTILFHIKAVAAMFAAAPGNKKFHLNAPSDDRSPCSRSAVPWSKTTHTAPPSPCQPKRCPAQIPAR